MVLCGLLLGSAGIDSSCCVVCCLNLPWAVFFAASLAAFWVVLGRSQLVYVRFGEFCVVLGWSLLVLAGPAAFCVVLRCSRLVSLCVVRFGAGVGWSFVWS